MRAGEQWILEVAGLPVACSAFNAKLPDIVRIGGVFTTRALRGRGHARAVVAGSLLGAREQGVSRAILFTGMENHPARAAYRGIGFEAIGEYGLMLLAQEHSVPR